MGEFIVDMTGLLGFSRLKAGDKYEVALYPALKLSVMEDCSLHNIIIMRLSPGLCTILQGQYRRLELPNV